MVGSFPTCGGRGSIPTQIYLTSKPQCICTRTSENTHVVLFINLWSLNQWIVIPQRFASLINERGHSVSQSVVKWECQRDLIQLCLAPSLPLRIREKHAFVWTLFCSLPGGIPRSSYLTYKCSKATGFGVTEVQSYYDCGSRYPNVCVCQNWSMTHLKLVNFIACKWYLKLILKNLMPQSSTAFS